MQFWPGVVILVHNEENFPRWCRHKDWAVKEALERHGPVIHKHDLAWGPLFVVWYFILALRKLGWPCVTFHKLRVWDQTNGFICFKLFTINSIVSLKNDQSEYYLPTPSPQKTLPRDSKTPAVPRVTTSAGTQTQTPATGQSRRVASRHFSCRSPSAAPLVRKWRGGVRLRTRNAFWSPNQSSRSSGARMLWAGFVLSELNQFGSHICAFALESLADFSLPYVNYFPLRRNFLAGNNQSLAPLPMLPSSGLGELHISIVGVWSGVWSSVAFWCPVLVGTVEASEGCCLRYTYHPSWKLGCCCHPQLWLTSIPYIAHLRLLYDFATWMHSYLGTTEFTPYVKPVHYHITKGCYLCGGENCKQTDVAYAEHWSSFVEVIICLVQKK